VLSLDTFLKGGVDGRGQDPQHDFPGPAGQGSQPPLVGVCPDRRREPGTESWRLPGALRPGRNERRRRPGHHQPGGEPCDPAADGWIAADRRADHPGESQRQW